MSLRSFLFCDNFSFQITTVKSVARFFLFIFYDTFHVDFQILQKYCEITLPDDNRMDQVRKKTLFVQSMNSSKVLPVQEDMA